jgi:hypothetical protein
MIICMQEWNKVQLELAEERRLQQEGERAAKPATAVLPTTSND